jgi:hypothetical protein
VVFDVLLTYGALLALVLLSKPGAWLAAVLAAVLALSPQLAVYPAIVWKDVLFAGAACAGFAALAWAAATWARPVLRYVLLALSVILLTLAALARQNGAVVLPFAALALAWIAAGSRGTGGPRRGVAHGLAFLAAGTTLTLAATAALDARLEAPDAVGEAWRSLQVYDLVAATVRDPHFDLDVLDARAPRLARLVRADGVAAYSPVRIDSIKPVVDGMEALGDVSPVIADQWRSLILRRPLLYLRVRASAFRWVFLTPRPNDCVLIETGVDGPPEEMAASGLKERDTPRDDALDAYALGFSGTPVFSHATFGAAGLVLLALLLRRRRPADIAVAAMLVSAFAFVASFAVISVACDYRYLYFLDLSVIAAGLYAASAKGMTLV